MAILLKNQTNNSTTNQTSITIPAPTNGSGDVLFAVLGSGSNLVGTTTPPSGWTTVIDSSGYAHRSTFQVFYKVSSGSEPANYTFSTTTTGARIGATILSYSGVDNTSPVNISAVSPDDTGWSSPMDAPSVTATKDGCLIVHGWIVPYGGATYTISTDTWQYAYPYYDYPSYTYALGSVLQSTAGATGTSTATPNFGDHGTIFSLALTPQAAAPTPQSSVTVIDNLDDINPALSGQAFATVSSGHGFTGNGGASSNGGQDNRQNWILSYPVTPSSDPITLTALVRNNFSGVALGGVVFYSGGGGNRNGYQLVLDNRNSNNGGQDTLQIRKDGTTTPLIESNAAGPLTVGTWYRVELTIKTASPQLSASVYDNSTNSLLDTITVNDTSYINQTLYPGFFHYSGTVGGMSLDNLSIIDSSAPPPVTGLIKVFDGTSWSAKPVKVWNGIAWIQKPVKRWNGSAWV